jgi:hypothetical protein
MCDLIVCWRFVENQARPFYLRYVLPYWPLVLAFYGGIVAGGAIVLSALVLLIFYAFAKIVIEHHCADNC